ncbi:hypothetical protein NDU88_004388 [Pleurodeles waltl]|uniref:Uncharacterized protein n=1 Tax=Pleurodeles waltl TaxID=8319 RepID=A0AAV7NMJ0_PLEWA|nr:hypothetical protein NDU88_004388 [Pleurodeles waltl]
MSELPLAYVGAGAHARIPAQASLVLVSKPRVRTAITTLPLCLWQIYTDAFCTPTFYAICVQKEASVRGILGRCYPPRGCLVAEDRERSGDARKISLRAGCMERLGGYCLPARICYSA